MKRYAGLDTLRGLTLCSMIGYHACWDLCYLFGQDWGWYPDPNQFVGCHYDHAAQTLYIFEEFRGNKQSNAAWAEKIAHHKNDLILADPGSGGDRNAADFRAYGFRMREAIKGPGSVAYGIKWLQSRAAIVIDPERCRPGVQRVRIRDRPKNR